TPAVTIRVWPSGCVCHAVRAPGSNVTLAPATRAGAGAWNRGSMRAVPVNQSDGPLLDGCAPIRLISIFLVLRVLSFCVLTGSKRKCVRGCCGCWDVHEIAELLTQQAGPRPAIRGVAVCHRSACWFCTARTCL